VSRIRLHAGETWIRALSLLALLATIALALEAGRRW
jgi:hypothetical protein